MRIRVGVVTIVALAATASSAQAAGLVARGSVEQVQVTGARHGAKLALLDRHGHARATQRAGKLGGAVFRGVAPGGGYRVRQGAARTRPFTVLTTRSAPPSTKRYGQKIPASGYGYLTTRDGTQLAIDVHLPSGSGPYPTLVEYSGYGYANPDGPQSSIAPIANLLGFAVVDVNMRGTGCSGGAFDYFERLQGLDGYDVVETVARQPWALHHKVGMMGISYGGISQLFVAATQPPSLAAIAPLSVIDDSATTLYPGGVLNTGFALAWAKERRHDAEAASPTGGEPWALKRIRGGDATCKANQALHPEAVDPVGMVHRNRFYVHKVADPLAPVTFVHKIKTPVYLACQWTDEQTGGHCPTLASRFSGTTRKWFTFTNGTHTDSLDPATFNRWYDFLELYVARRAPKLPDGVRDLAPTIFTAAMGIPGVTLPDDPIQAQPSYAAAKRAFERAPAGPCAVRQRCRRLAGGAIPRLRALVRALAGARDVRPVVVPRIGRRAEHDQARRTPAPTRSPGTRSPGPRRASRATPAPAPAACGRRRPPTTGARPRPGARCPTSAPRWAATPRSSAPAPSRPGSARRRRASTCRRPSPRCARTARRRSCRTAGCARACARWTASAAPSSRRV